jgi:hypothetical protein
MKAWHHGPATYLDSTDNNLEKYVTRRHSGLAQRLAAVLARRHAEEGPELAAEIIAVVEATGESHLGDAIIRVAQGLGGASALAVTLG